MLFFSKTINFNVQPSYLRIFIYSLFLFLSLSLSVFFLLFFSLVLPFSFSSTGSVASAGKTKKKKKEIPFYTQLFCKLQRIQGNLLLPLSHPIFLLHLPSLPQKNCKIYWRQLLVLWVLFYRTLGLAIAFYTIYIFMRSLCSPLGLARPMAAIDDSICCDKH